MMTQQDIWRGLVEGKRYLYLGNEIGFKDGTLWDFTEDMASMASAILPGKWQEITQDLDEALAALEVQDGIKPD